MPVISREDEYEICDGEYIYRPQEPETALEEKLHTMRQQGNLKYLGRGRQRIGYLLPGGKTVVKFPRSRSGVSANQHERKYFVSWGTVEESFQAEFQVIAGQKHQAACRTVGKLLLMEHVERLPHSDPRVPTWSVRTDWDDKGLQAGVTRSGRIAFFDYAGI